MLCISGNFVQVWYSGFVHRTKIIWCFDSMCVFEFLCDFSMHCPDVYFILSSCIWLMNERVIWVCSAPSSITYAPQLYFFWCVKFCCELKPVLLLVKFNKWRKLLFIYKPILAWLNSAHNGFINYKYFGGFNLLGNYWVVIQIDWFYFIFLQKARDKSISHKPSFTIMFFSPLLSAVRLRLLRRRLAQSLFLISALFWTHWSLLLGNTSTKTCSSCMMPLGH